MAYAISWAPWPAYALGWTSDPAFLPVGPLLAALAVIAVTGGRAGFRRLGRRLVRWRVAWYWYAVALLLPVALVAVTAVINAAFGASVPGFGELAWGQFLLVLGLRLVNPLDSALGEEPEFRGWALPVLQSRHSPVVSALVLGVLAAGWHLPLVVYGWLGPVGLPSTVVITFLYVWLFNRTGGSLLFPVLFHASQGAFTFGSVSSTEADLERAGLIYAGVLVVVVSAVLVLDRRAWSVAPPSALEPLPSRSPAAR
ncbi:UNVERIFIED_CONTAM: type II CAAX endopeptidase family protein [Kocuria sp. CPCC 205316]|uniref:CPBP family intramembrane glutamic endopeptidase n=1 Tax=Kocuria TaxID=57493 RepID=UPI0036D7CCB8